MARAPQRQRTDPTRVVFFDPLIPCPDWALLLAVKLVIHAMPGNGLDQPTFLAVKIRVLVPAGRVEKEIPDLAWRPGRQAVGGEFEREFIAAVQESQSVVAPLDQLA